MKNPHADAGRNALKQAHRAVRRHDLAAAERWSKTAERLAAAAERFAALPAPEPVDSEAVREDLFNWISTLVEANNERMQWLAERDDYLSQVSAATRAGAPLPPLLRDAPVTEEDLLRMAGRED